MNTSFGNKIGNLQPFTFKKQNWTENGNLTHGIYKPGERDKKPSYTIPMALMLPMMRCANTRAPKHTRPCAGRWDRISRREIAYPSKRRLTRTGGLARRTWDEGVEKPILESIFCSKAPTAELQVTQHIPRAELTILIDLYVTTIANVKIQEGNIAQITNIQTQLLPLMVFRNCDMQ